jgi:hypothetical protein
MFEHTNIWHTGAVDIIIFVICNLMQGLLQNHEDIAEYFRIHGVSVIFLFRRNLLRRMISVLANEYDRNAKILNGTHKSHVHSPKEVCLYFLLCMCTLVWVCIFMAVHLLEFFIVCPNCQIFSPNLSLDNLIVITFVCPLIFFPIKSVTDI